MESKRVGRYALVKLIGRGGMADVWIGKAFGASGFEKIVAIKLLAPYNVDREDFQRALTDEARILVNLKHPNIVDVYDLNFEAENPYLVMEFVEGTELRDLLRALRAKKQTLPLPLANYIISEVSKALSHAHERKDPQTGRPLKIVHRDISPSNILISSQGDVKLSDFGIAKSSLQSGQTQVGLIKGKFRYMSPEHAEGKALDGRADMFSLGLVYYECLFGEPAYDGSSDVGIFQMARTGVVKIPTNCPNSVGSGLAKLVATRPQDRFVDLASFRRTHFEEMARQGLMGDREALAEFLETLNLPQLQKASEIRRQAEDWDPQPTSQILTDQGTIQTLAEEMHKSRRWWMYGAGGAGIAAIALLTFWTLNRSPTVSDVVSPETRPVAVALPETAPSVPAAPAPSSTAPVKAQGSLSVETVPSDASVQVAYGDKKFTQAPPIALSDLPFGVPVTVTASKKGFKTTSRKLIFSADKAEEKLALTLSEIKDIQVRFVAEPYAAVTIPGYMSGVETPIAKKSLPPGDYDVTFAHAPSGHRVVAKLRGREGGSFLCSADMGVGENEAVKAFCRVR
ncbi:MAG TPA: serine/threonine-protein kinase [bacterium]|nr:serine/threonine-protein kinase [bacterium]